MLLAIGSASFSFCENYTMRVVYTILLVIDDSAGHILRIIPGARSS